MKDYKTEICNFIDENWELGKNDYRRMREKISSSKYLCLFGAGQVGKSVAHTLLEKGIKIDFFCDNNNRLWEKEICLGINCISIKELQRYKNEICVLVTVGEPKDVYLQLKSYEFNNVYIVPQLMIQKNIYFETADLNFTKNKAC